MRNSNPVTPITNLRLERGLTQKQLADKAGVSKIETQRIERGYRPVSPDILERLADALGVEVDALYKDELADFAKAFGQDAAELRAAMQERGHE
jgi:transcriptional regulator with XRE-family HTH domain